MPKNHASLPQIAIEYVPIEELKIRDRRVRRHTPSKIRRLAKFIQRSGVVTPLIVDAENAIILGNARYEALKVMDEKDAPVIRVTHLNETMVRALILADNQFTLNADWYKESLREELTYLSPLVVELGLELTDLGFETPQLDILIGDQEADELEKVELDPRVFTKLGDVWVLGRHKLICGDARDAGAYAALLGEDRADMVFADLPFNVPVRGHVCGNGAVQHKEFVMGAGEMTPEQFIAFMHEIFSLLRQFSKEGSIHMQCMDWRHNLEILTAARQAGYDYLNMACWVKHTGGMGSFYRSQHELVHIFKSGDAPHTNNMLLGKYGRNRTNVWNYDGANSFRVERRGDLALHSTTKPVDMVADAIKDCTRRNAVVLDPTAGSGSTLMAAERTGRTARLIELDPQYCDVIIRRWQGATGQEAVLCATGQSFKEVLDAREA